MSGVETYSEPTIWWPVLCDNTTARDALWNPAITVNTAKPDFTDCFQSTVLSWLPCAILWISCPFFIAHFYDHIYRHAVCAFSCMNAAKIVFSIGIMVTRWLDLLNVCLWKDHAPVAQVIAPLVFICTLGLALFLTRYEFRKGEHSSGTLFCFWLLMLLSSLVIFYSQLYRWLEKSFTEEFELYNNGVFFSLVAFQFALHLFADQGALTYLPSSRARAQKNAARHRQQENEDSETKPLLAGPSDRRPPTGLDQKPARAGESDLTTQNEESPELRASFLSRISYVWTTSMLLLGYKRKLVGESLWQLNEEDRSTGLVRSFYRSWCSSSESQKFENSFEKSDVVNIEEAPNGYVPDYTNMRSKRHISKAPERTTWQLDSSIVSGLFKSFGRYYILGGIFEIFNIILTFVRPLVQDLLIGYVDDASAYEWQGFLYAFTLFGITIIRGFITQQGFMVKLLTGIRIRSAVTAAVYRKALLLAGSSRKNYSVGEIVNLMAVDAQRMADSTLYLQNLWSAPISIIVAMVLLWQYLGPASLAGLAVLLVLIFVNTGLAAKMKKLQLKQMIYKDERTKLTNEVLNGIKVLKLYAWEEAFNKRVCEIRDLELSYIERAALYISGTVITFSCAPVLFAVVSFSVYMFTSGDSVLSASVAFVSLSLLSSLTRPLAFLPNAIGNLVQAQISIKRLDKYLNGDELDPDIVKETKSMKNAVEVVDGTFSWDENIDRPVLQNVNLEIERGSLTAVVGQVGCGKSSLLSCILGELQRIDGDVYRGGSIAYIAQEPWIRNQTLEKNVLFGQPMDRERYEQALDVCALRPDLQMLTAGDQTEIGERGINLSGGQKARVSLARAVYQQRDIYLLDDPLSAVDSHVGKHIFEQVISNEGVLGKKTRVLVTHGITHLHKVDQIIVLKDGRISECGTYDQLLRHDGAFAEFIRSFFADEEEEGEDADNKDDAEHSDVDEEEMEIMRKLHRQVSSIHSQSGSGSEADHGTGNEPTRRRLSRRKSRPKKEQEKEKPKRPGPGGRPFGGRRLIDAEGLSTGGVKWDILIDYLRAVGWTLIALVGLTLIGQIGSDLAGNIWLAEWSGDEQRYNNNESMPDNLPDIRVGVYGGLGGLQTIAVASQSILLVVGVVGASRILHKRLLDRILHAPMSFFDTTPVGRILNRFSSDMVTVDSALRMTFVAGARGMASLVTTLIAITYTAPIFLVAIIPLSVGYYFLQRFYIMSSNQIRRLTNVRTSPIYSHFGESISGASTIRAFRRQREYIADSDELVDHFQMAKYASVVVNRWLTVWLECLGALVVLFAALFSVLTKGNITGGLVGLSISYSLQVTDRLAMFLRNMSDLENNIVSVERIMEYSNVDQEAEWRIEDEAPPPEWPPAGSVRFNDYSTRYRPGLDLVLKNISATFQGGEKVGIVGRTGAGKSSMTLSLFRIIEAAEGAIVIDDVTTGRIGLHDLRTKITIIPQDPVLFSGTLRFNLDPFNERSDEEVWSALGHAHLKNYVASLPEMLEHECTEGGSNLSVGQRQLVCLARALLRKTRILVLDEATAAIDLETDNLIQSSIRSEFRECTVITIAHRINTVMDYDRILVMEGGSIAEFDSPNALLAKTDGSFYAMCKDAGIVS